MRKDFHKELNHYKESDTYVARKKIHISESLYPYDEEEAVTIHVDLFDFLEGIDDHILNMIN